MKNTVVYRGRTLRIGFMVFEARSVSEGEPAFTVEDIKEAVDLIESYRMVTNYWDELLVGGCLSVNHIQAGFISELHYQSVEDRFQPLFNKDLQS